MKVRRFQKAENVHSDLKTEGVADVMVKTVKEQYGRKSQRSSRFAEEE